jgi:hypothetical protein
MSIYSSQKSLLLSSRCFVMIVHATSPIAILAPQFAQQICPWSLASGGRVTYSSSSPALSLFFFFLLLDAAPSFFWWTTSLVHDSSLSHSKPARTGSSSSSSAYTNSHQLSGRIMIDCLAIYLLLELLMDSIQCILDGDTFQVSGSDLKPKREVEVNFLNWRICQELLQCFLVVYCRW